MSSGRIHILDEIEFAPGARAAFLAALEKHYRPAAEDIGLRLRSLWLDPALEAEGVACRALLDWELGEVADFWAWRARGGAHPELVAFWADAAPQIARRARRYVREVGSLAPAGPERSGLAPGTARSASGDAAPERGLAQPRPGVRRTVALIRLRAGAGDAERAALERALALQAERAPGVAAASLGRNLPGTLNGGDYTLELGSHAAGAPGAPARSEAPSAGALVAGLSAPLRALVAGLDEVALEPIAGGLREPGIGAAIKRTLLLRVLPEAASADVAAFERALLAMPQHIAAIRNWSLSRVCAGSAPLGWTHAWEQDFADVSGLADDYMNHPVHWSLVDGWFHAEDPRCIVAPVLAHVFCGAQRSLLSHAFAPVPRS